MVDQRTWENTPADEFHSLKDRRQWKYARFAEDMEEAGYDVEPYRGRGFYDGPAVRIDNMRELQDVIRETDVRVQWDGLGLGLIIYPE